MRRLPFHVELSFLAVHVVAFAVVVQSAAATATGAPVAGQAMVTSAAAAGLAFGATAALCRRTWGIGLMLAAAVSFFVAAVLGMGPGFFYVVAGVGVLPFLVTVKYMARFHLGATVLFAALAGTIGTASSLAWSAAGPTVIAAFAR